MAVPGNSRRPGTAPRSSSPAASSTSAAPSTRSSPNRRLSGAATPEHTPKASTGSAASADSAALDRCRLSASSGNSGGRLVMAARKLKASATMPRTNTAVRWARRRPADAGGATGAADSAISRPRYLSSRPAAGPAWATYVGLVLGEQRAQHVLHDPAVPVVLGLAGGVDPHHGLELGAVRPDRHLARNGPIVDLLDAGDLEHLAPGQAERGGRLPRAVLQWQHAHADQVGPVDPLERLGQHRPHAEQQGALGRPVPGRAGAVLLAAQHEQRGALLDVLPGRVVDGHLLAVRQVRGDPALGARGELVAQPDVGERAADHHLVVAAPRAVGVEVL